MKTIHGNGYEIFLEYLNKQMSEINNTTLYVVLIMLE